MSGCFQKGNDHFFVYFLKNICKIKYFDLSLHYQIRNKFHNLNFRIMTYFVEYNAKYIAMYKSLKSAQNFIVRKGLKNDEDNILRIWDSEGNELELN